MDDGGGATRTVLGHAVRRVEDPALITGEARFLDDLDVDGTLHAAFVRSPVAHALVGEIDTAEAEAQPGVVAVLTAGDLDLPPQGVMTGDEDLARPILATDRVRFAGETVAVVLAESREGAVDAAELVGVDYDPLEAVTDPVRALDDDAPLLYPERGSNVVADREPKDLPDFFADADRVLRERFAIQRVAPVPLEANGCVAVPTDDSGLRVHASTQSVFGVQREIAEALGMEPDDVRVSAPAIGGGFGAKGGIYPEQVVVAAAARRLGRPVRYAETRSENLLAMTHGRGQVQDVEIGVRDDGTVTALRVHVIGDAGAYATRAFVPFVTRFMASGTYRIPKVDVRVTIACTNTTPTGPYRGAGRPEAAAIGERTMDLVAHELGLDPAEVRRRNLIPSDAFPYTTATKAVYDSGDYHKALDEALRLVDYDELRAEQRARRERDDRRLLGIGLATYVEVSGMGSEYGSVDVADDGRVTITTGSVPHGQGHETAWTQIASAVLGVPQDAVTVVHSDTATVPRGTGTFGSRSGQLGGGAVHQAATEVWDKAKRLAADLLEAAPEDMVVQDSGRVGARGAPQVSVGWDELARAAADRDERLRAELDFEQEGGTFPFGAHAAVVEVDAETGLADLVRMVAVDDCGRVLNPLIVAGQVHGGVAQGIAQILYEAVAYDEGGNPLTSLLAEYGVPSAAELPSIETAHTETPSPNNPLGAKGVGESGTTGATSAVWNAVIDALGPFGVRHLDPPATPERVWRAIHGEGAS